MKAQRNWADQPAPDVSHNHRPHLKLVAKKSESPEDTPTDKAVNSVSEKAEIVLALLAQGLLVFGIFIAPGNLRAHRHVIEGDSLSFSNTGLKSGGESCTLNSDCASGICGGSSNFGVSGNGTKACISLLSR
jgi:hypothetical protein